MYLHLGQDTVVKQEEIIGIFDLETSSVSKLTRQYLTQAQKTGEVVNVSAEMPKSFVPCCGKNNEQTVYIAQLSTATLLKRSQELRRNGERCKE